MSILPPLRHSVYTLCALLTACGDSSPKSAATSNTGSPVVGESAAAPKATDPCKNAADDGCYADKGLLGTWQCVTDVITVAANGALSIVGVDGQRAAGCITCDGEFEAQSTDASTGSPAVFSVVGGTLAAEDAESSAVAWSYCNEVSDLDACRRQPEKGAKSARCYVEPATEPALDGGAPVPPGQPVALRLTEMWTPTMITVAAGDTIAIAGAGVLRWYTGVCDDCTSTPAGGGCPIDDANFLLPGVRCWSLVAKIGEAGAPFYVGEGITIVAPASGELFIGVNDDNFVDNTGQWTATVDVRPGA
jgi:hypothetical protein